MSALHLQGPKSIIYVHCHLMIEQDFHFQSETVNDAFNLFWKLEY